MWILSSWPKRSFRLPMKLKFDSTQPFQIAAVEAIVNIFDGQPLNLGDFTVEINTAGTTGQGSIFQSELGIGNNLTLNNETLLRNLHHIQEDNDLNATPEREFAQNGLNFSVEMETGTGKTYVYLRTIFELSRKYGFKKFIVVVPSVAIREGTLKNIEITREHFRALYNNLEFEHFVYDSKKANRLRQFATSNSVQIMVINIDAFRKDFSDSEDDKKSNVIFKESDKLSGRRPIEFVQATRPIVVIDEPQSVDTTPRAQEAIRSLNPLCIFRYSATHKNMYNLVYRLDPIKAFELRLVKQIIVASVEGANAQNAAYIKLLETDNKNGIRAKVRIQVQGKGKVSEKDVWVKQHADLYALSNEREVYRNGFEVQDISAEPGNEFIDFSTAGRLYLGQERGGIREDLAEVQIRNTIKKHLDKELQVKGRGIKVLSLFFLDRVANYREYGEDGKVVPGKYALLFERHYRELIALPQYRELDTHPVEKIHDGYFSQDKKGVLKDTNGATQADDDTYAKIMRNKEQLLSLDEPLQFIFSHSALREGWDNPNVFQICMLRETGSAKERRQTIGRGLRLPVNQAGERVFDEALNKLTVVATESYAEFAEGLQREYEAEGIQFGKVPQSAFARIARVVQGAEEALGRAQSERVWGELVRQGVLDESGKIKPAFNPQRPDFHLNLPVDLEPLEAEVIAVLQAYQLERHIKKDEEPKRLRINKQVFLDPEFEALWNRIKYRTTYEVRYSTSDLIAACVRAVKQMDRIEPVQISYREALLGVEQKGVTAQETRSNYQRIQYTGGLPDVLAYLQKETELTRSTLMAILTKSGRLGEFAVNPQKFMDAVAGIVNRELHRMMVDGIKYERIGEQTWSMRLFEEQEVLGYLNNRLDVKKSVYDAIVYDSEVERKFAEELDRREDIRLFVKLPHWFQIETPIGTYNPDWAVVKHDDATIYLVRETKGTKDFEQLRSAEADKIRCGRKHFEALGVDFGVVVGAGEV